MPSPGDQRLLHLGHPGLACLTLTEVNPDHDPAGELSQQLVSHWTSAIAAGLPR